MGHFAFAPIIIDSTLMSFKEALKKSVLVQDGALGTQLEALIPLDDPHSVKGLPLWSTNALLYSPELISSIHKRYVEAGADMIITATYQASPQTLSKYENMDLAQAKKVWTKSVECALEATRTHPEKKIFIGGSIGPYGAYLANGAEYSGDYGEISLDQLMDYHRDIVRFYAETKEVDVIAFETVPNFAEVQAIFSLIEQMFNANLHKEFYVSLSCKDADHLVDGTPLEQVIRYILSKKSSQIRDNLVGIGCNCVPFEIVSDFIETVNRVCQNNGSEQLSLLVYPNLGFEPTDTANYAFRSSTEKWASSVAKWTLYSNVRVIGGCCSTGPAEIAQIKNVVEKIKS